MSQTQPDSWNPAQYDRFKAERQRPFFDLLALVQPAGVTSAVDLGCGTGELTRELHRRLPAGARTVGVDSSAAMLAKAAPLAGDGLTFVQGTIEDWRAAPAVDLIYANASFQWTGDQRALLTRLRGALREGGQLAFQVPANHDHPSHLLAAEIAREPEFAAALGGYVRHAPVLPVEQYAELVHELGFRRQTARLEVYGHELARASEVVEWVKGTLLTDYQKRLPPDVFARFLGRYRDRLVPALGGDERPYFYAFKRILVWGQL